MRRPKIADIVHAVSVYFGSSEDDLTGRTQCHPVVHHRQIAMMMARELTDHSTLAIGRFFTKDHTTVVHAGRVIQDRAIRRPVMETELEQLKLTVVTYAAQSAAALVPDEERWAL